MFFFIAGVQPRTVVLDERRQLCPACGHRQVVKKRTDHYLSLFFLPIIPVKKGKPYLYCSRCNYSSMNREAEINHSKPILKGRCARCGTRLDPEFMFCPHCGKDVR